MENPHEEESQAPDTPPLLHTGTEEDTPNTNTVPHTLEFHHAGCPTCTTSLTDDTPIIPTTTTTSSSPSSSQDNYQDLKGTMLSRAYDVMDIFHADGPVIREVRLSVQWTEAVGGRFTDMDSMDHKEKEALLGVLKNGKDGYRLRVEFVTFPRQTEIREALDDEETGMASVEVSGPDVEGTDEY